MNKIIEILNIFKAKMVHRKLINFSLDSSWLKISHVNVNTGSNSMGIVTVYCENNLVSFWSK